ncbi:MAG: T9SS type A sorting domain-containing protein [Candidatus Delongbacteria bacterium]|nr:T9SS type A sorting domain-containing protein [Candidatus Delongbacteria bacterium]MBN2834080.1 T9SS type A sorting domain-containing protein [Candidatus Delongbacteria bacterium]
MKTKIVVTLLTVLLCFGKNFMNSLNGKNLISDKLISAGKDFILNENFDSVTPPALPEEWVSEDGNGNDLSWVTMAYGQSQPNGLVVSGDEMAMNDWVFSPGFSTTPNTPYTLKFSYKAYSEDYPERFEIMYGNAQNSTSMINVISEPIDVDSETFITDSIKFTTDTSEIIHIGFHGISDEFSYFLILDDIQLTGEMDDLIPPKVSTPTGTIAHAMTEMKIKASVFDQTGISEVIGYYKLDGQNEWTSFDMEQTRVTNIYQGTILSQPNPINGKVKFTCTDTNSPNPNIGDSEEFDISWINEPDGMWVGSVNAVNNGGLGLQNNIDWTLGLIVDLGIAPKRISKLAYMCNEGTNGPLNWRVFSMIDSTTWGDQLLIEQKELTSNPIQGTEWNEISVNDTTLLSGLVGLVVDLPSGGFFARDINGLEGRSYVLNYTGEWIKLGETYFEDYPGDWVLKCYVEKDLSGVKIEEEITPSEVKLLQNYPNPFNPATNIRFNMSKSMNVMINIYNMNGQLVKNLVNDNFTSGNHIVKWNATDNYGLNVPSGMYMYRLATDNYTDVKKMILVR